MDNNIRIQRMITELSKNMWIGSVLQVMNIMPGNISTAAVMYDSKYRRINLMYSNEFVTSLSDDHLKGVLIHEISHITEAHIVMYGKSSKKERKRLNFAMDLVINQKIKREWLPEGALFPEHFKDKNGNVFPENLSVEQYYDLLEDSTYENTDCEGEPQTLDEHSWEDSGEFAEACQDLLKRAQNHYEKSHQVKCQELQDRIDIYSRHIKGVNFKEILLLSLRKATPGNDFKKTWSKTSRRYGNLAKGNIRKPAPTVDIYGDTSGSMTIDEINDIVSIMGDFIKTGAKQVNLGLFHHDLYLKKPFKKSFKFDGSEVQSGGTDLTGCFEDIKKHESDLAIFITDGHYDMPSTEIPKDTNLFFIIKEGGKSDHCLSNFGKTIVYQSSKK